MIVFFILSFIFDNDGSVGIIGEDINIKNVFQSGTYTGKNVSISIVDRGMSLNHESYRDNIRFENNIDAVYPNGTVYSPQFADLIKGTAAASVAVGKIGVARDAKISITSLPLASSFPNEVFTKAFSNTSSDIIAFTGVLKGAKAIIDKSIILYVRQRSIVSAFEHVLSHRPKTIMLFSAGDFGVDPVDVLSAPFGHFHAIGIVGSTTSRGSVAYYSQWSPSMLINAPSGGGDTYFNSSLRDLPLINISSPESPSSYDYSNGTGISTAIVAGAIALILEKSPGIDYRNVFYRLILSATRNDPKHPDWVCNAAKYCHNPAYGFGRLNVEGALSINNLSIGPLISSTYYPPNEQESVFRIPWAGDIPKKLSFIVNSTNITFLEFVNVEFTTRKEIFTDLLVRLEAPSGTVITLHRGTIGQFFKAYSNYPTRPTDYQTLGTRAFFGENPKGIWNLYIKHAGIDPLDEIWGLKLKLFGTNSTFQVSPPVPLNTMGADPYLYNYKGPLLIHNTSSLSCNQLFNFSFDVPDSFIGIGKLPLSLQDPSTNRVFDLSEILPVKGGSYLTSVPCIFSNSLKMNLSIRNPITGEAYSSRISTNNNHLPNTLIGHEPYEAIKFNASCISSIDFSYVRHSVSLPEHGFYQYISVSIFGRLAGSQIYLGYFRDTGSFTVKLDQNTEHLGPTMAIAPMYSNHSCEFIIHPFRLVDPKRSPVPNYKFLIPMETQYCSITQGVLTKQKDFAFLYNDNISEDYYRGIYIPVIMIVFSTLICLLYYCTELRINEKDNAEGKENVQ